MKTRYPSYLATFCEDVLGFCLLQLRHTLLWSPICQCCAPPCVTPSAKMARPYKKLSSLNRDPIFWICTLIEMFDLIGDTLDSVCPRFQQQLAEKGKREANSSLTVSLFCLLACLAACLFASLSLSLSVSLSLSLFLFLSLSLFLFLAPSLCHKPRLQVPQTVCKRQLVVETQQ